LEIRFLGTGASEGVPVIGCDCSHCATAITDERSRRLRSAILLTENGRSILLDAGIDIRQQLLTYQVRNIDAVLVTHEHYDHAYGLREFKYWPESGGQDGVTQLCAPRSLLNRISFLYDEAVKFSKLKPRPLPPHQFTQIGQFSVKPVRIIHTAVSFGYLIQTSTTKIVYLSDISATTPSIMDKYKRRLSGSDCLIINAPFFENQPGRHIGVREAIRLGEDLDCKKLVLSHINHHNLAHRELHDEINGAAIVAFDGMVIEL